MQDSSPDGKTHQGLNCVKPWSFPGLESLQKSEVQQLFNAYWKWRISETPEFATRLGIHDYDALLDDVSEAANLVRFEKCHEFLAMANELEPSLADEADIINLKVLKYELETFINFYDLKGFYLPMNYLEGPQVHMEQLFDQMLLTTYEDYDVMIRRLENLSIQIHQIIDVMKAGVLNNITYHEVSMKHLNQSIGRFVVEDPTEFPLYDFFRDGFPDTFTSEQIRDIQERVRSAIAQDISPAYEKLLDYVSNEYVTREDIAITSINRGDEFYDSLIWFHTSTNYTAEEIQNIGFSEVERIEEEMQKIIDEMGYENMSTLEFANMIRNDPNNYYNNSDDLIAGYERIAQDLISPRLSQIFKNIPKAELSVAADPAPYKSGANYQSGSFDGSRPGVFYVRTFYLDSQPKYRMMSLSLHEGNPGHHFQRSYSIESPDFPLFRRAMESWLMGMSPSRFPRYTYFVEGWALYAEGLGFDMNLYGDPLERYGHYNEEMYRACRLVVDTGMHALGWTREEAIYYMFNYTAKSKVSVENQIDRYITWPGQALGYKMGQMKFEQLRNQAEEELGDRFDIKNFHDIILSSYGSLDIVEDQVQKWIDKLM